MTVLLRVPHRARPVPIIFLTDLMTSCRVPQREASDGVKLLMTGTEQSCETEPVTTVERKQIRLMHGMSNLQKIVLSLSSVSEIAFLNVHRLQSRCVILTCGSVWVRRCVRL